MLQRVRLATITDVLLVVLTGLVAARLVVHVVSRPSVGTSVHPAPLLRPGTSLSVPGLTLKTGQAGVVLFASPTCYACRDSLSFYQTLSRLTSSLRIPFAVLSAHTPDSVRAWLNSSQVTVDVVAQVTNPMTSGFYVSPTICVINRNGVVDTVLAARLLPGEEQVLLARLSRNGEPPESISNVPDEIDQRRFRSLSRSHDLVLVDGRKRPDYLISHRPGAVNIPLQDLLTRVGDLPTGRDIVLDCPRSIASSCPGIGTFLRQRGVNHVSLLFAEVDGR